MARKQKYSFQLGKINFVSLAFLLIIGGVCLANIGRSATAEFEESLLADEIVDAKLEEPTTETIETPELSSDNVVTTIEAAKSEEKTSTVGMDFSLKRLIVRASDYNAIASYKNVKKIYSNYYTISFDSAEATRDAYVELSTTDGVLDVVPDMKVQPLEADLGTAKAYEVDTTSAIAWGVQENGLDLYSYWNVLNDYNTTVKVSVIDSGINQDHVIFGDNRIVITNSTKNYITNNASPADDNGHGTGVAGVIAESTPENVKIYPSKVLNDNGETSGENGVTNILYAVANAVEQDKVDIINLSLGVSGEGNDPAPNCSSSELSFIDSFFAEVRNAGTLVIAAAGNDAKNSVSFPANCSNVVAVSATNANRSFASDFSNYGPEIEFAMPGSALNVPWIVKQGMSVPSGVTNENILVNVDGTSFSAPFLSAAAALIKTENPNFTPAQIITALKSYAIAYNDTQRYGNGLVDFKTTMFGTPRIQVKSTATDWVKKDSLQVISVGAGNFTDVQLTRSSTEPSSWNSFQTTVPYFRNTIGNITENGEYFFWAKVADGTKSYGRVEVKNIDNLAPNFASGPKLYESDGTTVGADIIDSQSGLNKVTLYYRKKNTRADYTSVNQSFDNLNTQTSAKFTLSGLDEDETYESYLVATDKLGNSSTSNTFNFTARAAAVSIPDSLPEAASTDPTPITPEAVKTNVSSPVTNDPISTSVSIFAGSSAAAIIVYYLVTRRRH